MVPDKLSKQIQKAILNSDKSRYKIAKDAGVKESTIQTILQPDWGKNIDKLNIVLSAIKKELTISDLNNKP